MNTIGRSWRGTQLASIRDATLERMPTEDAEATAVLQRVRVVGPEIDFRVAGRRKG